MNYRQTVNASQGASHLTHTHSWTCTWVIRNHVAVCTAATPPVPSWSPPPTRTKRRLLVGPRVRI